MPLNPKIAAMLAGREALSIVDTPLAQFRDYVRKVSTARGPLQVPLASIEDREIPGPAGPVRVRVYTPLGQGPFPLLLYFHGGGWVVGDLDTQDGICRALCFGAGCVVMSVDYRLAPEHRFPAAPDDCYAAAVWAATHAAELNADAARLAVGGDSAGGILAAGVALRARDEEGPRLCAQLLFYGEGEYPSVLNDSMREFADGPILTLAAAKTFWQLYLADPEHEQHHYLVSPARARNHHGLPPAFVGTAECDLARDGAEAYGAVLKAAGVPVVQRRYEGMCHGFYNWMDFLPEAQTAIDEAAAWLRERFDAAQTRPAAAVGAMA